MLKSYYFLKYFWFSKIFISVNWNNTVKPVWLSSITLINCCNWSWTWSTPSTLSHHQCSHIISWQCLEEYSSPYRSKFNLPPISCDSLSVLLFYPLTCLLKIPKKKITKKSQSILDSLDLLQLMLQRMSFPIGVRTEQQRIRVRIFIHEKKTEKPTT
jgi:hypothetical protein